MTHYRLRRFVFAVLLLLSMAVPIALNHAEAPTIPINDGSPITVSKSIEDMPVKGRAPKTGYTRSQFGDGWAAVNDCDTRNLILQRDLIDVTLTEDGCKVAGGLLNDPYTAKRITFIRGAATSDDVQIDHVVALSNAWQTGAQQLSYERRVEFANDPLNLLAVDGPANQNKSDSDAATWLPPNKLFRCQYVNRQVAVKRKYGLWLTSGERDAISRVLQTCG